MVSGVRPRILVIEDDESVARMLELSLTEAGFDTIRATNGGEALHILEQQPPDAAILDLQLPNGQGGAVLDWLRQSDEQAAMSPVWVVISALDRGEATRRYGSLGSHFLAKPFDPWDLVAIIENGVSARREPQRP
jgi:DNA-binding response OmpR family regulator